MRRDRSGEIIVADLADDFYNVALPKIYAVERGVPANNIIPDYGGYRTYDTCYRARHVFNVEQAVLVTRSFHLPQALLTCQALGIDAVELPLIASLPRRWYEVGKPLPRWLRYGMASSAGNPDTWEATIAPY
ncbi:MAG: ElyC/SanA/YdcF family protein [Chloroflexota bacterium]